MPTYSYTTTPAEDAAIAYALNLENQRRAALTPSLPPLTAGQYILQILQGAFSSYAQQKQGQDIDDIQAAYKAAPPAKQAAAKQAALDALK